MKTYQVYFRGYRRDEFKDGLPSYSGIYCVYRCTYNPEASKVALKELIYIGQSTNIHDRIVNHEKRNIFLRHLQGDEQLCYTYAHVDDDDLDIVENALIFMQQPVINDDKKDDFNYDDIAFIIEGETALFKYTDFNITSKQ